MRGVTQASHEGNADVVAVADDDGGDDDDEEDDDDDGGRGGGGRTKVAAHCLFKNENPHPVGGGKNRCNNSYIC